MRTREVIWAFAVCALAWGLVAVAWPRGDTMREDDSVGVVAVRIDPASVTSVVASGPAGTVSAERRGGAWWLDGWPASEPEIGAAVRALATATLREAPEAESASFSLEVSTAVGRTRLELSERTVGGRAPGRLTGPDGAVRGVLVPASLRSSVLNAVRGGWRSPALAPRIEPGPSRVEVRAADDGFAAVRIGGRWRFEGSEARPDAEAIEALISRAASIRAAGWLEASEDEPTATVTLETVRPNGSRWVQRLALIAQADLAGGLVSVRASRSGPEGVGSVRAAVPASAFEGLPASEAAVTDRRSVDALAAEVVEVRVGGRTVTRDPGAGTWRDAVGVRLGPAEADAVERLLRLLTEREGTISADAPGQGVPASLRLGGETAKRTLTLHPMPGSVVVRDGVTARSYSVERVWGLPER